MMTPAFTLGVAPPDLRPMRRDHSQGQHSGSVFPAPRPRLLFQSPTFAPVKPLFNHFPERINVLLASALRSPKALYRLRMFLPKNDPMWDTATFAFIPKTYTTKPLLSSEFSMAAQSAIIISWRLRRFLHRWRVSRLVSVNTEDIATGDVPIKPVHVVDWKTRPPCQYVYEAATIARDIRTRLLNHSGFFEEPLIPRNPLTNLPFTQAQNIAVWSQLSTSGVAAASASVIAGFRHSRFDLDRFSQEFNTLLKLHALRVTMADVDDEDTEERVDEFIDTVFRTENLQQPTEFTETERAEWTQFCLRWLEAGFLHINNAQRIKDVYQDIIEEIRDSDLLRNASRVLPNPRHIVFTTDVLQTILTFNANEGQLWNPVRPELPAELAADAAADAAAELAADAAADAAAAAAAAAAADAAADATAEPLTPNPVVSTRVNDNSDSKESEDDEFVMNAQILAQIALMSDEEVYEQEMALAMAASLAPL